MTRCLDRITVGNKTKQWRQGRREQARGVDEDELLYLQGLCRCRECDNTYPRYLDECPYCKAKSI